MKYFLFVSFIFLGLTMKAQVGIGTITPNSTLSVEGSLATKTDVANGFPITLDQNNHTILSDDVVNLPDPSNIIGREYVIKTDAVGATVNAQPGDLIDGSLTPLTLNPFESVRVKAVGAGVWLITGGKFDGAEEINDLSDGKTLNNSLYVGENSGLGANGTNNVGMGTGSLINVDGTENIGIGYIAGATINSGSNNIVIGTLASGSGGSGITTGNSNILIGDRVNASGQVVSNELNIGNALYGTNLYGATARIGIGNGNNAPNSTLSVNGSMSLPIRTGGITTLGDNDYTYLMNGAAVTLPAAAGKTGRIYVIKNIGTNPRNLGTTGSDRIDGSPNQSISANGSLTVQSDGISNWYIISTR